MMNDLQGGNSLYGIGCVIICGISGMLGSIVNFMESGVRVACALIAAISGILAARNFYYTTVKTRLEIENLKKQKSNL